MKPEYGNDVITIGSHATGADRAAFPGLLVHPGGRDTRLYRGGLGSSHPRWVITALGVRA